MKENFPNLAKEIDFQEVQEAQRVPKKLDPRRSKHIKERKKWDNCNSIINKIYLKKEKINPVIDIYSI